MTDKLNILVAYPYCTNRILEQLQRLPSDSFRFLLDSGAFTSWNSGKPIKLEDYCNFIITLPVKPWRYFVLDVIGNPSITRENYTKMRKLGFNPVPIYTPGENPLAIEEFYKTSDVVGFGGINGFRGTKRKGYINGLMKHVKDRRAHWLGFIDLDYIKAYKPYMCDASSWESGAQYGQISLYLGAAKSITIKKTDFTRKPPQQICDRIQQLGINPYELATNKGWSGGNSTCRKLSARSSVRLSLDIQRQTATKMFLAVAAADGLRHIVDYYLDLIR